METQSICQQPGDRWPDEKTDISTGGDFSNRCANSAQRERKRCQFLMGFLLNRKYNKLLYDRVLVSIQLIQVKAVKTGINEKILSMAEKGVISCFRKVER